MPATKILSDWNRYAHRFEVKMSDLRFRVERSPHDSEKPYAVFLRGIGETFRTDMEAAIYIRVMARYVDGYSARQ